MLRKAAAGPGKWAVPADLWCLRENFGLARSFLSVSWMASAAQLRVRNIDQSCCESRTFRKRVWTLRCLLNETDLQHTRSMWRGWYDQSFLLRLDDNQCWFTKEVCEVQVIREDILSNNVDKSSSLVSETVKTHFQRAAYARLLQKQAPSAVSRVRDKLVRWKLTNTSRHPDAALSVRQRTDNWLSEKTVHNLRVLGRLVPPRVQAAVFSTVWNRWATHRRYQQRSRLTNICRFGCSDTAEDAIEHYAYCPLVQDLGARYLRLQPRRQVNMHTFMMCNPAVSTEEDLTAAALLVYAAYRAFNHQRHSAPGGATRAFLSDALRQWVREGAMGHSSAMGVMRQRWQTNSPSTTLPPIPTSIGTTIARKARRSSEMKDTNWTTAKRQRCE